MNEIMKCLETIKNRGKRYLADVFIVFQVQSPRIAWTSWTERSHIPWLISKWWKILIRWVFNDLSALLDHKRAKSDIYPKDVFFFFPLPKKGNFWHSESRNCPNNQEISLTIFTDKSRQSFIFSLKSPIHALSVWILSLLFTFYRGILVILEMHQIWLEKIKNWDLSVVSLYLTWVYIHYDGKSDGQA